MDARRNSKKNKIYLLKVENEQIYFHSNVIGKVVIRTSLVEKNKIGETEARSDAPFRCEHRKATASGGGNFTCWAAVLD